MLTCLFGSIVVLIAMFIHAHNVPANYFLLATWTVMQALTVAAVGSFFDWLTSYYTHQDYIKIWILVNKSIKLLVTFYDLEVVVQALVVTVAVVGSLFVYTIQSKRDWSKGYALLASLSIAFLFGTLLQVCPIHLIYPQLSENHNSTFYGS